MLHTLSQSPAQCDLFALMRFMVEGDDLLLLQDGVLSGLEGNTYLQLLLSTRISLHALQDDLEARGLVTFFSKAINVIKYHDFLTLTEKHRNQMAW
ncbi:sulfurtransferase complex subunit TusB [Candidatus Gillettellia adelgis]